MKLLIDIHLDGYETKEEHDKACLEFVEEQLNFTASYIKVLPYEEKL
jgi:hypothetical protein